MSQKTNLSLPFYFRNIGPLPPTRERLRMASPLKVRPLICSPYVKITVDYQLKDQERIHCVGKWDESSHVVHQLLSSAYPDLALWEIAIYEDKVRFHLLDRARQASGKHAIDGYVMIQNCQFLQIDASACPFRTEPARTLHCKFGDDAKDGWGRFVTLATWSMTSRLRQLTVYPEATEMGFWDIVQH